jgi:hypothetical protein
MDCCCTCGSCVNCNCASCDLPCCQGPPCDSCWDLVSCSCHCKQPHINCFYDCCVEVGSPYQFSVTGLGSGPCSESCIIWAAPGGHPESQTGGALFTTHWNTPGVKTVTATTPCGSKSKQVYVVDCSPPCDPSEHCENCQCVCDTCWDWKIVPASSQTCPPCEDLTCPGTVEITGSYEEWFATTAENGFCKHPTKTEIVGHRYNCGREWDYDEFARWISQSIICESICELAGSPLGLVACAVCLIVEGIIVTGADPCIFVKDCIPVEPPLSPIEKAVVEIGADWGDVTKCP